MDKTKTKKTKSADKLPKPIKVKKEKTEEDRTLHPMSHFIDDRLELVKQIFGTLKAKTVINLSPDFLKNKKMEEIEEMCLDELLCISTKRLKSVINATKCPTDTETSEDSDVEHQEEHISLEEISSDSEIEGTSTSTGKHKSNGSSSKTGSKKNAKKTTEKSDNDPQISVLELLELQARARAIRSQLALEPITKIEVDSDDQNAEDKSANSVSSKVRKRNQSSRKLNSTAKSTETTKSRTSSSSATTSKGSNAKSSEKSNTATTKQAEPKVSEKPPTKKIKLKRNYRMTNRDSEKNDDSTQENRTTSIDVNNAPKVVKKEVRSPSPDVIPIVPQQETFYISDSSDDEKGEASKKVTSKVTVTSEKPIESGSTKDEFATEIEKQQTEFAEAEEGEIFDQDEENADDKNQTNELLDEHSKKNNDKANGVATITDTKENEVILSKSKESESTKSSSPPSLETKQANTQVAVETSTVLVDGKQAEPIVVNQNGDDVMVDGLDDHDDIISIEGGDLESEMIEHLEDDTNTNSSHAGSTNDAKKGQDACVISLESSEDDRDKDNEESWHSRYIKSSKVSKVLAVSRLGKRVRDKIKKSKHSKAETEREKANEENEKSSKVMFTSKHEDGSIEQYKELLEIRQRKS